MLTKKDHKRYADLLHGFAEQSIVVVGDIMLDRYKEGTVYRISPEAPVAVLDVEKERYATGGAGNVAKNVVALGAYAVLISAMGVGTKSQQIYDAATKEGYDCSYLFEDPQSKTTVKTRHIAQGQQLLRVDDNGYISDSAREKLLQNFESVLRVATGVIVSDYDKGVLSMEVVRKIKALTTPNIPILGDIKPNHARWFEGVDMLSPNEKEARAYINDLEVSVEEVARMVAEQYNSTVFLTAGSRGIFVSHCGDAVEHIPQLHRFEVRDVTGCGDTAAAVTMLAKLSGATLNEAATLANAAAAVTASKIGAVAPTLAEVLDMLSS